MESRTAVVVENEADIRQLRGEGFGVHAFASGEVGMRVAAAAPAGHCDAIASLPSPV